MPEKNESYRHEAPQVERVIDHTRFWYRCAIRWIFWCRTTSMNGWKGFIIAVSMGVNTLSWLPMGAMPCNFNHFQNLFGRDAGFNDHLLNEPQVELERIYYFIGYRGKLAWKYDRTSDNVSSERIRKFPDYLVWVDSESTAWFRFHFITQGSVMSSKINCVCRNILVWGWMRAACCGQSLNLIWPS